MTSVRWGLFLYVGLVAATAAIAAAGYGGFVVYGGLQAPDASSLALLGFAAATGIAAFFSPCSFSLLVALLGRTPDAGSSEAGESEPSRRPLAFAGAMALGAVLFLALLAGLVALGAGAVVQSLAMDDVVGRVLRSLLGAALILLGLVQLNVLTISAFYLVEDLATPLRRAQARVRRRRPLLGYSMFGFGYLLAGFG